MPSNNELFEVNKQSSYVSVGSDQEQLPTVVHQDSL